MIPTLWKRKLMGHFKGRSLNNFALVVHSVNEVFMFKCSYMRRDVTLTKMFVCRNEDFKASDEKILGETFVLLGTLTAQMNSDGVTYCLILSMCMTCNLTDT